MTGTAQADNLEKSHADWSGRKQPLPYRADLEFTTAKKPPDNFGVVFLTVV
jgi:hypothetical protein